MRRGRWILASLTAAALVAAGVIRLRARRGGGQPDAPADVGFMRALRAALRRDLARLRDAAGRLDGSAGAPSAVLVGWDAFRAQLENHHSAEDDDLWPVLRRELSEPGELASVDAMVEEHRHIPPALAAVDVALRGGGDPPASAERLSAVVLDHLAHEEREVLPLLEQHLTPAQWRAFLRKERNRDRICRIEGVKCAFDYDAAGAPEPLTPRGARRNVPPNRMFGTRGHRRSRHLP